MSNDRNRSKNPVVLKEVQMQQIKIVIERETAGLIAANAALSKKIKEIREDIRIPEHYFSEPAMKILREIEQSASGLLKVCARTDISDKEKSDVVLRASDNVKRLFQQLQFEKKIAKSILDSMNELAKAYKIYLYIAANIQNTVKSAAAPSQRDVTPPPPPPRTTSLHIDTPPPPPPRTGMLKAARPLPPTPKGAARSNPAPKKEAESASPVPPPLPQGMPEISPEMIAFMDAQKKILDLSQEIETLKVRADNKELPIDERIKLIMQAMDKNGVVRMDVIAEMRGFNKESNQTIVDSQAQFQADFDKLLETRKALLAEQAMQAKQNEIPTLLANLASQKNRSPLLASLHAQLVDSKNSVEQKIAIIERRIGVIRDSVDREIADGVLAKLLTAYKDQLGPDLSVLRAQTQSASAPAAGISQSEDAPRVSVLPQQPSAAVVSPEKSKAQPEVKQTAKTIDVQTKHKSDERLIIDLLSISRGFEGPFTESMREERFVQQIFQAIQIKDLDYVDTADLQQKKQIFQAIMAKDPDHHVISAESEYRIKEYFRKLTQLADHQVIDRIIDSNPQLASEAVGPFRDVERNRIRNTLLRAGGDFENIITRNKEALSISATDQLSATDKLAIVEHLIAQEQFKRSGAMVPTLTSFTAEDSETFRIERDLEKLQSKYQEAARNEGGMLGVNMLVGFANGAISNAVRVSGLTLSEDTQAAAPVAVVVDERVETIIAKIKADQEVSLAESWMLINGTQPNPDNPDNPANQASRSLAEKPDSDGRNLFHYLAAHDPKGNVEDNYLDLAYNLISMSGFDPTLKDKNGISPLDIAIQQKNKLFLESVGGGLKERIESGKDKGNSAIRDALLRWEREYSNKMQQVEFMQAEVSNVSAQVKEEPVSVKVARLMENPEDARQKLADYSKLLEKLTDFYSMKGALKSLFTSDEADVKRFNNLNKELMEMATYKVNDGDPRKSIIAEAQYLLAKTIAKLEDKPADSKDYNYYMKQALDNNHPVAMFEVATAKAVMKGDKEEVVGARAKAAELFSRLLTVDSADASVKDTQQKACKFLRKHKSVLKEHPALVELAASTEAKLNPLSNLVMKEEKDSLYSRLLSKFSIFKKPEAAAPRQEADEAKRSRPDKK